MSDSTVYFRETQRFRQLWLWALLLSFGADAVGGTQKPREFVEALNRSRN